MAELESEHGKARRFAALILVHRDAAFNLALWLTKNREDAEDIVQESFLRAYKFFAGFRGEHGRPWLLKIVRNTYYTAYNKQAEQETLSLDADPAPGGESAPRRLEPEDPGLSPQGLLEQADGGRLVNAALGRLPAAFREILVLRELEDLSYKDIAQVTGLPLGTVMSRLYRARDMLHRALQETLRGTGHELR